VDTSIADTSIDVQNPEGIEWTVYPAGLVPRACAFLIDGIAQSFIMIALGIFFSVSGGEGGLCLALLTVFIVQWFYFVIFEMFFHGQSPGKKILGLAVIKSDGAPVDIKASFLRNILRFADTFLFLFHIAFLSMVLSRGFKRLGDMAGDTLVVYSGNSYRRPRFDAAGEIRWNETPGPGAGEAINGEGWTLPRKLSFKERQALLMFARRYPYLGVNRGDEIVKSWVDSLGSNAALDAGTHPSEYALNILRYSGDL